MVTLGKRRAGLELRSMAPRLPVALNIVVIFGAAQPTAAPAVVGGTAAIACQNDDSMPLSQTVPHPTGTLLLPGEVITHVKEPCEYGSVPECVHNPHVHRRLENALTAHEGPVRNVPVRCLLQ